MEKIFRIGKKKYTIYRNTVNLGSYYYINYVFMSNRYIGYDGR